MSEFKSVMKLQMVASQQSEKGRFKDTDLSELCSFLLEVKKKNKDCQGD